MITVLGKPLRMPSPFTRLVVLSLLSVALMIADHRGQQLVRLRQTLTVAITPIEYLAAIPSRIGSSVSRFFTSSETLEQENQTLKRENLLLRARTERYDAVVAENARLRELLGAAAQVTDRAVVADILRVSPEPFSRSFIIAKGAKEGIFLGQPVIDSHGIMGQVTEVGFHQSRVTLITDPGHAIPVLDNRSGLRTIVFGTGAADKLSVPYLTGSADIREGDLLVSSGMGGRFPPNYPVARVTKIVADPNEAFLDITAVPTARLNYSKEVLLIWPGQPQAHAPDATKR